MTPKDIVDFINKNGENGILDINITGEEEVTIRTDVIDGEAVKIKEIHDFKYTRITLTREDITVKKELLQKQLEDLV